MSGAATEGPPPSSGEWARVHVHPGAGVVHREGDALLVVPVAPASQHDRIRELLNLCRRPDPSGRARVHELRAFLELETPGDVPGFALLIRAGSVLTTLVHGAVQVVVDGRLPDGLDAPGGAVLAEHTLEDGAWHRLTVAGGGAPAPDVAGALPFDLGSGTVPGAAVTLLRTSVGTHRPEDPSAAATAGRAPAAPETSSTALRPTVQFRTVLLGECARQPAEARRRQPLPIAGGPIAGGPIAGGPGQGAAGGGTRGQVEPEVLVEGVLCSRGHFNDPELASCPSCGASLPPGGRRVTLPRPPLGILVTDGGTVYTVTGNYVIGREAERSPQVLAGRALPLPLRDAARSTSRAHARLTVSGWKVLISDNWSANGTFLSRRGAGGPWLPLTPEEPVALVPGDRIRLGKRQLLFDCWRETPVPQVFR
jgi:hypothetical protein